MSVYNQAAICYYELSVNHQAYDTNDNVQWGTRAHNTKIPLLFPNVHLLWIDHWKKDINETRLMSWYHLFFLMPLVLAQPKFEPKPPDSEHHLHTADWVHTELYAK